MTRIEGPSYTIHANNPSKVAALGETFPLNPLDHILTPRYPVQCCFVYPIQLSVDRMRRAISLLIDYYPHFTGRYKVDKLGNRSVQQLNSGVPLYTSTCESPLADARDETGTLNLLSMPEQSIPFLPPYDYETYLTTAPLALRLTNCPDGSVIGVLVSHALVDGTGMFQLVKHLAELYTQGSGPLRSPPLIARFRSIAAGPAQTDILYDRERLHEGMVLKPIETRHLRLSATLLARLKSKASMANKQASRHTAITALIWRAVHLAHDVRRQRQPDHNEAADHPPDLNIPFSFRGSHPDIPLAYSGNSVWFLTVLTREDMSLAFAPLSEIAGRINAFIRRPFLRQPEKIDATARWIEQQPDKHRINFSPYPQRNLMSVTQWNWKETDQYRDIVFDGVQADLMAPAPIGMYRNVAVTMPPRPGLDGMLVILSLERGLWGIIEEKGFLNIDSV